MEYTPRSPLWHCAGALQAQTSHQSSTAGIAGPADIAGVAGTAGISGTAGIAGTAGTAAGEKEASPDLNKLLKLYKEEREQLSKDVLYYKQSCKELKRRLKAEVGT